ncbi:GDSL-like Lipase/Acylhydrolase [Teratosphaeria destructans]|uniref:GDSL-like Lipase/Acylhydrolase n=1 Tax=Teratosphaeria destructans TaxID=418781 RepID=A0A9W7SXY5_9PEZI|nr:GDSL-like Lipase/Acylhydrolase [Teratosphaeria destructans]
MAYAEHLIDPKHKALVTTAYLRPDGSCMEAWGARIQHANSAINASLSALRSTKHLNSYDVFRFMADPMENKEGSGLTQHLSANRDGDGSSADEKWDTCILDW